MDLTRMQLTYLWVALGGALGSVARFWIANLSEARWGNSFPWGTLIANVSGSLLIGILAGCSGPNGGWFASDPARKLLMIGVCGGYTTFSSFSLQTLSLVQQGQWLRAGLNILGSVALCLIAVWLGHLIGTHLSSAKGN
ncbi:MAG: fluoride efflux transporter CrcB [Verrucomicrobiota bacterium]|mgnify:FL=1